MTKYEFEEIMSMLIREFRVEDTEEARDLVKQFLTEGRESQ